MDLNLDFNRKCKISIFHCILIKVHMGDSGSLISFISTTIFPSFFLKKKKKEKKKKQRHLFSNSSLALFIGILFLLVTALLIILLIKIILNLFYCLIVSFVSILFLLVLYQVNLFARACYTSLESFFY